MGPCREPPIVSHPPTSRRLPAALLVLVLAALVWSGVNPRERATWWLEVFPALGAIAVLLVTARRFPLTPLLYTLVFVHAIVLIVGGHYTYAEVPLGNWFRDRFHLERNHYDRLGHFVQGFVPAIAAREVLLRTSPLRTGKWLAFLVLCVCMAVSAVYELVEWAVSVVDGGAASTAFLGTQGDVWDTQKDMAMCAVGALSALACLSRVHDRQLSRLPGGPTARPDSPG